MARIISRVSIDHPVEPLRVEGGVGIAEDPRGTIEGAGGDAFPIAEGFRGFDPDDLAGAAEDGEGEEPATEAKARAVDGRRR